MIVLIGGEKGGVGKTTLAVNLAAMRAQAGKEVLLIDADKQASANLWAGIRREANVSPGVACIQKTGRSLGQEVRELATKYGDIIIDAGGRDSAELRAGLTVARLAVFPLQASLFDAATIETLSTLSEQASALNPELVSAILINRASTNRRVSETDEAKELIAAYQNLALMNSVVRDRIIYRKSVKDGLTVREYKPGDPSARVEMQSFYEEVFGDD